MNKIKEYTEKVFEEIKHIDEYGNEYWYEYDSKGNLIHEKWSSDYEKWYEYDINGKMIHFKDSDGVEGWYEYEYYQNKQIKKVTEYVRF